MTAAMRDGDFSAVPTPLQDPLTRVGDATQRHRRRPIPGNQIPSSRFDKGSLLL